jgi:hypothetical protein
MALLEVTRFAYIQARLQARHGRRLDERAWARFAAFRDTHAFLDSVRQTSLAGFSRNLSADQSLHDMERILRAEWHRYVREVGQWHSTAWRPAFDWLSVLPLVPAVEHLAGGGSFLPWMEAEPALAAAIEGTAHSRTGKSLPAESALLREMIDQSAEADPSTAWADEFMRRVPSETDRRALRKEARKAFRSLEIREIGAQELETSCSRVFRKNTQSVLAGLAHLGLVAGDLLRLRGELALRSALPRHLSGEAAE